MVNFGLSTQRAPTLPV